LVETTGAYGVQHGVGEVVEAIVFEDVDPGLLIGRLYDDLVEVEALAITADEAVAMLPPRPSGKYGRTMARLYTLVGKTAGRASAALAR